MAGRPKNTPEVLWSKVDVKGEDECWPWLGYRNKQGYGRTWIADKGYYAHRVVFDLAFPERITLSAPKSKHEPSFVLHRCDNPPCCNPSHMFLGTNDDNMKDKAKKGRAKKERGERAANAKLTNAQAEVIRHLYAANLSKMEIARVFGVTRSCISGITSGRHF